MRDEKTITGAIRPEEDDWQAGRFFHREMHRKLRLNKHKAHWSTVGILWLFWRLLQEMIELLQSIIWLKLGFGSRQDVVSECADVGNFAMMISENVNRPI